MLEQMPADEAKDPFSVHMDTLPCLQQPAMLITAAVTKDTVKRVFNHLPATGFYMREILMDSQSIVEISERPEHHNKVLASPREMPQQISTTLIICTR